MLEGTDVSIATTRPFACEATSCPGRSGGTGVAAVSSGTVRFGRFSVTGSALCGVLVAERAGLDLHAGVVGGSEIGACVQIRDYDTSRLADEVFYRDNGTTLSATMLPVPDAVALP